MCFSVSGMVHIKDSLLLIKNSSPCSIGGMFYFLLLSCPLPKERKGNVLFNDALNTFYLQLYGVKHMVKDHSDSEKGNLLPPHRLLLSINSKGSFICTLPQAG